MRKIESDMVESIRNFKPFSEQNTVFHRQAGTESGWELVLHGNVIATFDQKGKHPTIPIYVSLAGYPTKTTCSRLNALEEVNVKIKGGVPYLNGREIDVDGFWSPCNLNY